MEDRPPFGKTLARLRKSVRLTQTELGKLSGMTRGTVATLETGRDGRTHKAITPRIPTIRGLADALATNPSDGKPDQERANAFYVELAEAAGYFTNRAIPARERAQALLLRDPRIVTAFEAFPSDMDDDDVDALRRHLDVFADMLRRARR